MEPTGKELSLIWKFPEDLQSLWADNFAIQPGQGGTFMLSFFQQRPPILLGTVEDQLKALSKLEGIDAVSVAQVVIPAAIAEQIVTIITDAFAKLKANQQATQGRDK